MTDAERQQHFRMFVRIMSIYTAATMGLASVAAALAILTMDEMVSSAIGTHWMVLLLVVGGLGMMAGLYAGRKYSRFVGDRYYHGKKANSFRWALATAQACNWLFYAPWLIIVPGSFAAELSIMGAAYAAYLGIFNAFIAQKACVRFAPEATRTITRKDYALLIFLCCAVPIAPFALPWALLSGLDWLFYRTPIT